MVAPRVVLAYPNTTEIDVMQAVLAEAGAEVIHVRDLEAPETRETLRTADAVMVALHPVTPELLAGMERCKIISRIGTGIDAIHIEAATERGIWVTNVPDYSIDEVSTHAITLLLSYTRRIPRLVEATRNGKWDWRIAAPIQRLRGQTLGVVGFGRIGQAAAAKGRGLGLEVIAHDPFLPAEKIEAAGARPVDWETLLRESDFITLHVPLLPSTERMMNAAAFAQMKPTAVLINTARGGLVDEDALLEAVRAGRIAGAALDVLSVEPPPADHPLLLEQRVMVTPHIAFYSEQANVDMRVRAAEEVVRVLRGEPPRSPVNRVNGRG